MNTPINVLFIEDNPQDARIAEEELRNASSKTMIHLECVEILEDGLQRLNSKDVDAVLLNLNVPDSHGLETLKRVLASAPMLPVIVMTDQADEEMAVHAVQAGAQDYLIKGEVGGSLLLRCIQYAIQRKQAEEKLNQSESRYRLATKATNDVIWEWNAKTHQLMWTENAQLVFGYSPEEIGPDEKWWDEHIHPDDREHVLAKLNALVAGDGTIWSEEYRFLLKNGSYAYISDHAYVERDPDGQPLRMIGAMSNITDRKQAEQALQQSERDLAEAQRIARLGSWSFDIASNTVRWSEELYRIFGVEKAAFDGTHESFLALIHPDDRDQVAQAGDHARVSGEPFKVEYRVARRDNRLVHVREIGYARKNNDGVVIGLFGVAQDLTELKEAENALRESEHQMRALITSLDDIVFELDEDGAYLNIWTADESLLAQPKAQMLGRRTEEILGAEKGRPLVDAVKRVLESGNSEIIEYPLQVMGGSRWFMARISPILSTGESRRTVSMMIRDVTVSKQAEETLTESEEKFRTLIEQSNDGVILVDEQGTIAEWNQAQAAISGIPCAEAIGRPVWEVQFQMVPPEHRSIHPVEFFRKSMQSVFASGESTHFSKAREIEIVTPNGERRTITQSSFPIRTEKGYRLGSFIRDVTEYKRTEEELRQSEERFSRAFEYASIGMGLVGPDGRFLKVNRNLCEMLGYSADELITKSFQDLTHPDDLEADLARVSDMLAGRIQTYQMEKRYFHKNGNLVWALLNVSLVRDHDANPLYFISQIQNITERKRAQEKIQQQLRRLTVLRSIDQAIAGSMNLQFILATVLGHVRTELGVDAAVILLYDSAKHTLKYKCGVGMQTDALRFTQLSLGDGYAGKVALTRQAIYISGLPTRKTDFLRSSTFSLEGFDSYIGVPLIAKGEIKGVLELFHRSRLKPEQDWLDSMEMLARQVAIAIDNASLYEGVQRANIELGTAYDATIEGWSKALDLRDKETEGHTQRVTQMTIQLARAIGMDEQDILHMQRGALLHDIGKMGVPDRILLKPDALTEDEWVIMQKHPTFAFEMLSPIAYLRSALDIPYCHHEKWDGSGYPRGLKGEEIPLAARIFAVVDVWDALTSDRPYRPSWSREKALAYIKERAGKYFDSQVVDAFLKLIAND